MEEERQGCLVLAEKGLLSLPLKPVTMDKDCAKKSKERVTSKKSLMQELEVSIRLGMAKYREDAGKMLSAGLQMLGAKKLF